ncbi:hypothetical protein YH66_05250 [[Brevibacterium] flavum]|uniref:Major capsid protein n=1 Tax=[Brevibacterium] flavum TaxID=92706 RepID=A0A0F6SQY2_9CORY|nr:MULTISPECIES: hypothetical protein [Corynebacterium]AKF27004.1 hypothetical protein YH66_05250 [[Brevibacterium] flavum]ANE07826.1 hypothetical protein A3654_05240 [Corynebacterium glutamicum]AST20242.1 hypothetical protein CEY17_05305 [Corynebacterium glutamicum ATCC 14067]KEI22717.1 hypothetical protein KIQ_009090 [Corynebacterium glutamicum ATCC 14067]KIH74260.1 hypothetical protein SD36_05275 [Corynebacterium glutamicum]
MVNKVISIDDNRREVNVSDLLSNPEIIPTRALERLQNEFPAEDILTDGGTSTSMEFQFERNTQSYLDSDPEVVAEFGNFPTASPTSGEVVTGRALKVGYKIEVSREMKDFNKVQEVTKRVDKAVNTFRRYNERQLWEAMMAVGIPEVPVSVAWNQQGADPRYDLSLAMETVASGNAVSIEDLEEPWDPNMVVLHKALAPVLVGSEKWNNVYTGNTSNESIRYTGKLPTQPMGMDALGVRYMNRNRVLVLQKGAPGFFKDPRRLEATPMRGQGGDPLGGDNESYNSRLSQMRFVGIDEPYSACWLTGVIV